MMFLRNVSICLLNLCVVNISIVFFHLHVTFICMCVYLFKTFPILLNLVCTFSKLILELNCYKNCMVINLETLML